jgi:hypothetical protein
MKDWVTTLAIVYGREICDALGDDLDSAIQKNNEYIQMGVDCDAAHDYCDANDIMMGAFEKLFKREPDISDEEDLKTVNKAWKIALENEYFFVETST